MEGKFFCGLLLILCMQIIFVRSNHSAEETLIFIGGVQSKLSKLQSENAVIVVGYIGTGKSTLIHYLTKDNSKLVGIKSKSGTDYIIQDQLNPQKVDEIPANVSRTIIPEIIIDENQTAWIDCPGFGETRNSTVEIATAFSIKHIIDKAKNA